jgi:APA family basic amino acid/polyamine antiporter
MSKGLFVKKSIKSLLDEASDTRHGLKRSLGAVNLTAMGIGAIIGAGIFVLVGQAAYENAGPSVLISFVLAALICVFSALCYAEFASLIPISGSAYSYAYATMGELTAWIIGWGLTLEYLCSFTTVAVGWSGYFTSFLADLGITIPKAWSMAPVTYDIVHGWSATGAFVNLPAIGIIVLIGTLVAVGIKAAARYNDIMVVVKFLILLLFVGCAIAYFKTDNLTPFIPKNTGVFGNYGYSGILSAAGIIFFAFIGFDALSTLAQEAKNPQKNLPIGMLASLGISTLIYVIVAIVLLGTVSYTQLGVPDPFAVAVDALGPSFVWLRYVIKFLILISMTTVIMVMLLGQARIFYIMAHDGLLPSFFGKIHDRFRTPLTATCIVGGVGIVLAGLLPVGVLARMTAMGTLLTFAIVCFGVLLLRYKQPTLHRPFKTPLVPWIPLAGTLVCAAQMFLFPGSSWRQFAIWMLIGCVIYFTFGAKHSKVRRAQGLHKS